MSESEPRLKQSLVGIPVWGAVVTGLGMLAVSVWNLNILGVLWSIAFLALSGAMIVIGWRRDWWVIEWWKKKHY